MSEQSPLRTILKQPGFPQVKPLSDTLSVQSSDDKTVDLIKYQKNLEELRNTLSQIDSLLGEPATPEITARCASLLGYIAAIDLPAEIKNQEAGRYPPQVQAQVSRTLESSDKVETGTQAAQAAAYSAAIMQRVSEEAQIRIQQQAALAVETSRMTFENFMRESDANIAKMQRDFLNSPYSKEAEDRLNANIAEEYNKRRKEIERDGQIFRNNFKNMSPEELEKALEERDRQTQQMKADRIKHEQEAQKYLDAASQCPIGSAERNTYIAMANINKRQAEWIAENEENYSKDTSEALKYQKSQSQYNKKYQESQSYYNNVVETRKKQSDQNTTDEKKQGGSIFGNNDPRFMPREVQSVSQRKRSLYNVVNLEEKQSDQNTTDEKKQGGRTFGNNDPRFMSQKVQSVSQRTDQGEQQVNAFVDAGDSASKPVEQISQGSDPSAIVAPKVPVGISGKSLTDAKEFDMNGSSDVKETVVGRGTSKTIAQNSQKIDENNIPINSIFNSNEVSLG